MVGGRVGRLVSTTVSITNAARIEGRDRVVVMIIDIHTGWDDFVLEVIERETGARKALRGLDLSFKVLGHLMRDGHNIGLVMEASRGRLVEFRDRSKVNRFSKLP